MGRRCHRSTDYRPNPTPPHCLHARQIISGPKLSQGAGREEVMCGVWRVFSGAQLLCSQRPLRSLCFLPPFFPLAKTPQATRHSGSPRGTSGHFFSERALFLGENGFHQLALTADGHRRESLEPSAGWNNGTGISQSASKPSCSAGMSRSSTRSRRCLKTARGNACRWTSGMGRCAVKSFLDLLAQSRGFRRMRAVGQTSREFRQLGARQHRAFPQVLREGNNLGLFVGR